MLLILAQLKRAACRVLIPALLLWFGGISFLNCCASNVEAAFGYNQADVAQLSAASLDEVGAASSCEQEHCHKAEGKSNVSSYATLCSAHRQFVGPMPCCSRAGQPADLARKSRLAPERTNEQASTFELRATGRVALPISNASHARARGGNLTYLRDCVFLI